MKPTGPYNDLYENLVAYWRDFHQRTKNRHEDVIGPSAPVAVSVHAHGSPAEGANDNGDTSAGGQASVPDAAAVVTEKAKAKESKKTLPPKKGTLCIEIRSCLVNVLTAALFQFRAAGKRGGAADVPDEDGQPL